MSTLVIEYIRVVQKATVDTTFAFLGKAFDACQKLIELNAQAIKSILEGSRKSLIEGLSSRAPHVLLVQQESLTQRTMEQGQSYWGHLRDILSDARVQFATIADTQFRQYRDEAQTIVEVIKKTASSGSDAIEVAWAFPGTPG